ncbi:MAG: carboxypeptidase-like regulatory domain-containing protein, partial [bacterium]
STNQPLYFANVFLSGTTLGCATDKDGRYTIERVPPGPYDLVATMMGYEPVSASLEFFDEPEKTVYFKLKPIPIEGETISITAKYPKDWKENLKIFEQLIFGSRAFAKQCSLVNPEVLDFERSHTFRAYNEQPATFINNALGYKVSFLLIYFDARLHGQGHYGLKGYIVATNFEELNPNDEEEREKWIQNRLVTYNGSMRHFIRAVWERRLKEEGFTVSRLGARGEYKIDPDTLLTPGDKPSQYILKPCSSLLKITYNKRDDESYKAYMKAFDGSGDPMIEFKLKKAFAHQTNRIEINKPILITVSPDIVIITDSPVHHGRWSGERAPEWLPANYKPPKREE